MSLKLSLDGGRVRKKENQPVAGNAPSLIDCLPIEVRIGVQRWQTAFMFPPVPIDL